MRFSRQAQLPEIGEAGQARLLAASVDVPGEGLAAEIEARYLARAGVTITRSPQRGAAPLCTAYPFADESARAFGEGAIRALSHIVSIVEGARQ